MSLLGGWLCEVTYTNPLLPLFKFFYSNQRGVGAWALVPLSDSGAARICQRGANRVRERSDRARAGFPPPTVGRFLKIRV